MPINSGRAAEPRRVLPRARTDRSSAVFMTNLDLWIVNVALPAMGSSFAHGGRPSSLGDLS